MPYEIIMRQGRFILRPKVDRSVESAGANRLRTMISFAEAAISARGSRLSPGGLQPAAEAVRAQMKGVRLGVPRPPELKRIYLTPSELRRVVAEAMFRYGRVRIPDNVRIVLVGERVAKAAEAAPAIPRI